MGHTYCTGRDWTGAVLHTRRARSCDRCDRCPSCPADKGGCAPLRTWQGSRLCPDCITKCRAESDPRNHRPIYENDLVRCAACGDSPSPTCPQRE